MKNTLLTFALVTTFGAFMFASNSANDISISTNIVCDGEHKCDDKCEKDKDGKCAEASKTNSAEKKTKSSCYSKDSKNSCHGKKVKTKSQSKEETGIKS